MLEIEQGMLSRAELMSLRQGHGGVGHVSPALNTLSTEQAATFGQLVGEGDLKVLVEEAGSGKSRLLAETRAAWEAAGWTVRGAALSGVAAENLTDASGIPARTLASYEMAWKRERDQLTANDILVIDEAGLVSTRQLARVLEAAADAHAKVVLVGDPEQLQAIEAGAALRGIIGEVGAAELNEARQQNHLVHDYLDRGAETDLETESPAPSDPEPPTPETHAGPISMDTIDAIQQRAAERWREKLRAREMGAPALDDEQAADLNEQPDINAPDLSRGGIEDDLDL
jgi:ATP-dependent exoDNAse (exonuclease V) alpha subunit